MIFSMLYLSIIYFIALIHAVNGAELSNITPLFLPSALFAASSSPYPVLVIVSLTSMYASL